MHALHDDDDPRRRLVVATRKQGRPVPLDDPLPHRFRKGIARLQGVVNDEQVAAEAGQRALD